jgi:FkbM family methyltransferase
MPSLVERLLSPLRRRKLHFSERYECERVHLGSDYGGYAFYPKAVDKDSVVYSFGVGCDVTFDAALIEYCGATVHAFDPTPRSIDWVKTQALPEQFVFHPWGIADFDGTATFHPPKDPAHVSHTLLAGGARGGQTIEVPVLRLRTIMGKLGHDHIDMLKMDIEGAEYGVLSDVLGSGIPITQILIELHHHRPEVSLAQSQQAIAQLEQAGFRVFNESGGNEFSFIRPDLLR